MKWTLKAITEKGKSYRSRIEFKKGCRVAYIKACELGILDDLIPESKSKEWTLQEIRDVAKTFKYISEFRKAHNGMYQSLHRQGLIRSVFRKTKNTYYSKKAILNEALKYNNRGDFQKLSNAHYQAAKHKKILKECCVHMSPPLTEAYTNDELTQIARSYDTRVEFQSDNPGAYTAMWKRGLTEQIAPQRLGGISTSEIEVLEFLKLHISDFEKKAFKRDYELDCYSESLKLGIEYNGLYWHSDDQKHHNYHIDKTKYFEALGIRVIHIWEHEWRDRPEQVKNYLLSACGVHSVRIGARKCEFKEIEVKTAKEFLEATHIQGTAHIIKLALGAFYEGKLVAVSTFGTHHRKIDDQRMILNRFSCRSGVTVQGGLAKMSKMAFERLGPLKSWADYSKSQAKGYLAAGWTIEGILKPDYFYATNKATVISKQSRKKQAVNTPDEMTEKEHAKLDGLFRIYDCGKIVLGYA